MDNNEPFQDLSGCKLVFKGKINAAGMRKLSCLQEQSGWEGCFPVQIAQIFKGNEITYS
jgi:hypothetical protein